MKKHIAIITAAIIAFTLTACGSSKNSVPQSSKSSGSYSDGTQNTESDEAENVTIANPIVTVDSADELEKQLGIKTDAPEGASEVEYSIISGTIADICFVYGENSYCLRASEQSEDFSGLYGDETAAEQLDSANNAVLTVISSGDQTFLKLSWTDGSVNYILSNTDGGDQDEIKKVYETLKN